MDKSDPEERIFKTEETESEATSYYYKFGKNIITYYDHIQYRYSKSLLLTYEYVAHIVENLLLFSMLKTFFIFICLIWNYMIYT